MPVDRLSVTVPSELGAALRSLAEARGATVSTIVTDAIAHEVRMAALDVALAEADRRFGPVAETLVLAAAPRVDAPDAAAAKRAGEIMATTKTNDVVDAMLCHLARAGDTVITSDPADILALVHAARLRVAVVSV